MQNSHKVFRKVQVRRGKLKVILLLRVCDRAADEEHTAQKRRNAAVLLQIFLVNMQVHVILIVPERMDHLNACGFTRNGDGVRADILAP